MNENAQPNEPRRLYRSRDDRVVAGVCAGVARYFDIDPVIARIAAVVLVFFGGAGLLAYAAAVLLVPDEEGTTAANTSTLRGRLLTVVAVGLLMVAAAAVVPWGRDWFLGGFVVPLAILAFGAYAVWTLVSGDRERRPEGAQLARRVILAAALVAGSLILAAGAAWAGAVGGGEVVAGLVIVAGIMLAVGAFVRPVRWLTVPALALAIPLAIVSAAGIEVDNSIGERDYEPASVGEMRDRYELGMGSLVVDLRGAELTSGDHQVEMEVGMGEAVLLVPRDVCVASEAQVGMGVVQSFDDDNGGVDVDWDDAREAPADTPRILLDADVGIGRVSVAHEYDEHRGPHWDEDEGRDGNRACSGGLAVVGDGNG